VFGAVVSDDDQSVVNSIAGGDQIKSIAIGGDTSDLMAKTQAKVDEWNKALSG
jgi:peptidyl-prolyl cis-trans isomerase B (cyclophilin B)